MMLVGRFGPTTFTVNERLPLDGEEVVAQPAVLDELSHLRIARVQPVAGEVERKSLHDFAAGQAADPIVRFEQRESAAELARARQTGEPAACDHDVGERHSATHLLRHEYAC